MVDAVNQLQNDLFLLTPLREGRPSVTRQAIRVKENFYSRPCGRGDDFVVTTKQKGAISTHAPAGGATRRRRQLPAASQISTHAPAGGATICAIVVRDSLPDFYSRPCGRGDINCLCHSCAVRSISTHAPAGGATSTGPRPRITWQFLLTPLREGRLGDLYTCASSQIFLLTPLREGRHWPVLKHLISRVISTHAPAGGATQLVRALSQICQFLLTPLREGRPCIQGSSTARFYFYSRPCGRGDAICGSCQPLQFIISTHAPAGGATIGVKLDFDGQTQFLLTPLREGRHAQASVLGSMLIISTHAPAGGATTGSRLSGRAS